MTVGTGDCAFPQVVGEIEFGREGQRAGRHLGRVGYADPRERLDALVAEVGAARGTVAPNVRHIDVDVAIG